MKSVRLASVSGTTFCIPRSFSRKNRAPKRIADIPKAFDCTFTSRPSPQLPSSLAEQTEDERARTNIGRERYFSAYRSVEECPEGYWVENVEGEIPAELRGTYFRNGPGEIEFLGETFRSFFDANGVIASIAIRDGKAFFRSRFVRTLHSMIEEEAGRRLFTGVFGSVPKNGGLPFVSILPRNPGNGMPIAAGNKLLIAQEGAFLTVLDPYTLQTIDPRSKQDLFSTVWHLGMKQFFSPPQNSSCRHLDADSVFGVGDAVYDARRDVTVLHMTQYMPTLSSSFIRTDISLCEIDEDLKVRARQKYSFDRLSLLHSVGVTENYYVFYKFPMRLDMKKLIDQNASAGNAFDFEDGGVHELHLLPRPSPDGDEPRDAAPKVYQLKETTFSFHFINSFEEDGHVIVDATHYPTYPFGRIVDQKPPGFEVYEPDIDMGPRLRRTTLSPDGGVETREMTTHAMEFASVNPHNVGRRQRFTYMVTLMYPDAHTATQVLGKFDYETGDMETWTKGEHYFVGEPRFIPKPGGVEEEDGWIVAFCYDAFRQKTEFVILDAAKIADGPIAILYLEHKIGHGFHGTWSDAYYGP